MCILCIFIGVKTLIFLLGIILFFQEKRDDLLATHVTLKDKDAELTKVYENYRECDPDVINQMKEQGRTALEAANRWTDNVFSVKSWCTKKFGMDGKMIDKQFGIPEDFDYVEE